MATPTGRQSMISFASMLFVMADDVTIEKSHHAITGLTVYLS
jgi:hypothetical protein